MKNKIRRKIIFILIVFIISVMWLSSKTKATSQYFGAQNEEYILGDINNDGEITEADISKIKLHLIGKEILQNQALTAADVDINNSITLNDLAKLKLMSIEYGEYKTYISKTEKILGNLEEAVEKDMVTKYQFTYQIKGKLKENFEKQINGEQLDYSKDRFYLIKNEKTFGKNEIEKFKLNEKTFIYNPYRKTITEVPKGYELIKKKATWYWRSSNDLNKKIEDDEEIQNRFFDNLVNNYQISDIYLQLGPSFFRNSHSSNTFNIDKLKTFVKNAYAHNIRVYCLIGDVSYLLDENIPKTIYNLLDDIESYNNSVDVTQRIAGVSYDNEYWVKKKDSNGNVILDLEWKTNEEIRKKHVKYIKDAVDYAKEKNLDVNFALPFNISRYSYTDDNGNTVNMYDEITKILEEPILMIYRDDINLVYKYINEIQTDATESIIDISIRNGASINIAIDTARHKNEEEASQTFYEEELENPGINGTIYNTLNTLAEKIRNNNKVDLFTFSIHQAETLARFSGME